MDALVEILLLASSEMTVLTYSSNFGQLVFYLGVARKQRCPNAILVDTVHDTEGVLEYAQWRAQQWWRLVLPDTRSHLLQRHPRVQREGKQQASLHLPAW